MANAPPGALEVARDFAQALLIGFLIGADRESALGERHPGMRDFILISLVGAITGLLGQIWLAVAALLSIALLLAVFHYQIPERAGITTEMAAVATFFFGFLTATPHASLATGMAIVVVGCLEGKQFLHGLVRGTITATEFNSTLRFLALIFIIYPLLPEGSYGPYQFFRPRQIWLFVIVVSSISYVGYFLDKFLGTAKALQLTGLLGGLSSTTAATAAFARDCREEPERIDEYWEATLVANAIQGPRSLIVLYVVNADLAKASLPMLLATCAAGFLFARIVARRRTATRPVSGDHPVELRNPFRLLPALEFGGIFAAILLIGRAAAARLGGGSAYWTSAIGGTVNVDAVSVTLADLLRGGQIALRTGVAGVLVAWIANAVLKSILATTGGSARFGWRVTLGFLVMGAAGWAALAL